MRKILIAVSGMLCFLSCKKYPEGPLLSFRSREARIVNEWACGDVLVNNASANGLYSTHFFSFGESGNFSETNGSNTGTGSWELTSHDDSLICTINGNYVIHRFRIMKLKNKSIWLDENVNGSLYSWHLIPK
jgi:hypothetical protein